ncbi:type II toxin-antitoxin system TacA family antitoxin [Pseudomonas sp. SDO528_S397]
MKTLDKTLKPAKSARLEIKTTEFAKERIKQAASISGLDMTAFIIASAFAKAEEVIENHRRIELSETAFNQLQAILADAETAAPTSALLKLMRGEHENKRDANM